MKQTTFAQRLVSALVALCMVLSVCAPALAADSSFILIQKSGGHPCPVTKDNIGTLLPGYSIAYSGNTVTITMGGEAKQELDGVTFFGGGQDLVFVYARNHPANNFMLDYPGVTISGMHNVTVQPGELKNDAGGFNASLTIKDCDGDVNISNPDKWAISGNLYVDNTKGTGNVTVTSGGGMNIPSCGALSPGTVVQIASNGAVKMENKLVNNALPGQVVYGTLNITQSASVVISGGGADGHAVIGYDPEFGTPRMHSITSSGGVQIAGISGRAVNGSLNVNAGGKVTIQSNGDTAIKGDATIATDGMVDIDSGQAIAVEGNLTVSKSNSVSVIGNVSGRNAVQKNANITSSGAVNIRNILGIAVGGKLTVNNASGTGDVTVSGKGGNTVGRGAEITSRGAVNITNTDNTGLAVYGDLTVHDSKRVKVSGGNASVPAVEGNITLTSTGKMELKNSNGQVTSKKLTVKNSTGDVTVTGSKSGSAMVASGTDINTTGSVNITNSSGPAVYGGLNVFKSGGITVSGDCSGTAISGNSTINSSGKIDLKNTSGPVAGSKLTIQSSGAVDITGNGSSAALNEAEITSDGAVNITSNGGQAAGDKLTVNKSTIVKVIAVKSNYSAFGRTPSFANTEKVEIWNNGSSGRAGVVRYTPPEGMGFAYYTSNVSSAAKQHTHDTDIVTESSYLRIVTDNIYTLTLSDGVTATTGGTKDTKFYAGESVTVTAPADTETNKFKEWTGGENIISTNPTDWRTKGTFTFTMPAGNVKLDASYNTITKYDVKVNGGTIGGETGKTTGSFQPGDEVTVVFDDSNDIAKQFKQWKSTETEPEAPAAGWPEGDWQNSKKFTFKMPAGNVTLEAGYKTVYNVSVDDGRGSFTVNGAVRTQALEGETVKVKTSDAFFNDHRQFNGWSLSGDSAKLMNPSANWENSETFTFTMPAGNVSLTADYKQLYDLTVTGGTIVDENGDTSGIYLPGTKVTVTFTGSTDIDKQFKQWTGGENIENADQNWQNEPSFSFTMPADNVSLSAEYRKTYQIHEPAGKAKFFAEGAEEQEIDEALPGTRIIAKVPDSELNDHRQFNMWGLASEKELVEPDQNWQGKQSFRFTMPEGNVELRAFFTTLYDVNVTGGTIEGGTDDNGIYKKIVKPGELVTVRAESTEEKPFQQWTCTGTAPAAPDDGWTVENWETSREFTFKMPSGNVTLDAQHDQLYKVSIHDNLGNVTINGQPRESLWVKDGDTVTVATTLKDGYSMEFEKWTTGTNSTTLEEPSENWQTSTTFTFKMPKGPVELTAGWQGGAIEKPDPEDPNTEPLDPGFTVDPEPAAKTDTAGAALVAAAVGGAAVWGGYEVATRVLLHKLLPEGAAIPKTRAELALLLWNAAGQPEPAAVPAFADVADPETAKAAQWCTEQGCLTVKEPDRFQPDRHVTKYRVIDCWNKAFPAA